MTGIWIAVCFAAVSLVVFLSVELQRGGPIKTTVLKSVAGLGFLSVAVAVRLHAALPPRVFWPVFAGLLFGMAGDFLLAARRLSPGKSDALLLGGMAAFFAGHVCYLVYLSLLFTPSWIPFVAALIAAIAFMLLTALLLKLRYGKMFIPCCGYAFIVMSIFCCAAWVYAGLPNTSTLLLLIGCGLFVLSDVILAFIVFSDKGGKRLLTAFNLGSYFPAQVLIALSLAFI